VDKYIPDEDDGQKQTSNKKLHNISIKSSLNIILAKLPLPFIDLNESKRPTIVSLHKKHNLTPR
jgi:hypothetical protein